MSTDTEEIDPRCWEIRQELLGFLHERLGVIATGEVQGHLLICQACSEICVKLIGREIENGTEPQRTPPPIPPPNWYESYLHDRSEQFGFFWSWLCDALKSPDLQVEEWAREQMGKIGNALRQLFIPSPPTISAYGGVRNAVRTRGSVPVQSRSTVVADVLSASQQPIGKTIPFTVEEGPHITVNGHFSLHLRTQKVGYEGHEVVCTLTLPKMPLVSFSGTLKRIQGGEAWEVDIDEEGFACEVVDISVKYVTVTVVEGIVDSNNRVAPEIAGSG